MPKTKKNRKGILCIEGSWWKDETENRESVKAALDFVSCSFKVPLVYRTACTNKELYYVANNILKPNFAHGNQRKYGILYLAYHGSPGVISMSDGEEVTLSDLANILGNSYKNFVFYFGSCSVLDCAEGDLSDFKEAVGASCLIGYKKDVDWVDSALCDIAAISLLQNYISIGAFQNAMSEQYRDLVARNGFHVVK